MKKEKKIGKIGDKLKPTAEFDNKLSEIRNNTTEFNFQRFI